MENNDVVHQIDSDNNQSQDFTYPVFFGLVAGAVVIGVIIGALTGRLFNKQDSSSITNSKAKQVVGIVDKKTFKDQAEGTLRAGGIDGEGNFHLERPGGVSQNVYLTSTAVDMEPYVGKKVRVWGETFSSQKAGWLMDVGLVEVL